MYWPAIVMAMLSVMIAPGCKDLDTPMPTTAMTATTAVLEAMLLPQKGRISCPDK